MTWKEFLLALASAPLVWVWVALARLAAVPGRMFRKLARRPTR